MSQRIAHVRAVQLRLGRACAAELRGRWLASEHFGLQRGALEAGTVRFAGGWAPGLRRRSNEVSMLSGSPGPAEAAAARAQKRKFDSRCSDAESRNRKCRCGPHVWSRGPVVFCPLARANIETLPTGGGEHKTRRRRRPQRGGEHNHDPTTTTCNIPVPGQRCRRQGG